jgi:xylan 1,4-beta-xylosidase
MDSLNNKIIFSCDLKKESIPLTHFWEHTISSSHATMALRADWQKQLTRCQKELGFKHVRFHAILSDDMGTMVDEDDHYIYSFFNIDQIFDFLLSIGMKPFVELSFMPNDLASGNDVVFEYHGNITPPKDYDAWATLIEKLAEHLVARYGLAEVSQWFFEVWNEPNLTAFWKGNQASYFKLYQYTANAIKKVNPLLKVGGPATADNQWIKEFIAFCAENKLPADFVSTHHYPTDAFGKPGDDTIAQLAASKRSVLRDEATEVKNQAAGKPVYYTEWSTSSNPFDDLHDEPYASAFITKTIMEANGIVEGYSYWTFSDIFEENYFSSIPFHGGFGLMNIYGIPKPAYRAYELLHRMGNELLTVEGHHDTVDVWVSREPGKIKAMITNGALPRHPIKTETVVLSLSGIDKVKTAYIERIDENSANARRKWEEMGKPDTLSPEMVEELEKASLITKSDIEVKYISAAVSLEATLLPLATACITLEI